MSHLHNTLLMPLPVANVNTACFKKPCVCSRIRLFYIVTVVLSTFYLKLFIVV